MFQNVFFVVITSETGKTLGRRAHEQLFCQSCALKVVENVFDQASLFLQKIQKFILLMWKSLHGLSFKSIVLLSL